MPGAPKILASHENPSAGGSINSPMDISHKRFDGALNSISHDFDFAYGFDGGIDSSSTRFNALWEKRKARISESVYDRKPKEINRNHPGRGQRPKSSLGISSRKATTLPDADPRFTGADSFRHATAHARPISGRSHRPKYFDEKGTSRSSLNRRSKHQNQLSDYHPSLNQSNHVVISPGKLRVNTSAAIGLGQAKGSHLQASFRSHHSTSSPSPNSLDSSNVIRPDSPYRQRASPGFTIRTTGRRSPAQTPSPPGTRSPSPPSQHGVTNKSGRIQMPFEATISAPLLANQAEEPKPSTTWAQSSDVRPNSASSTSSRSSPSPVRMVLPDKPSSPPPRALGAVMYGQQSANDTQLRFVSLAPGTHSPASGMDMGVQGINSRPTRQGFTSETIAEDFGRNRLTLPSSEDEWESEDSESQTPEILQSSAKQASVLRHLDRTPLGISGIAASLVTLDKPAVDPSLQSHSDSFIRTSSSRTPSPGMQINVQPQPETQQAPSKHGEIHDVSIDDEQASIATKEDTKSKTDTSAYSPKLVTHDIDDISCAKTDQDWNINYGQSVSTNDIERSVASYCNDPDTAEDFKSSTLHDSQITVSQEEGLDDDTGLSSPEISRKETGDTKNLEADCVSQNIKEVCGSFVGESIDACEPDDEEQLISSLAKHGEEITVREDLVLASNEQELKSKVESVDGSLNRATEFEANPIAETADLPKDAVDTGSQKSNLAVRNQIKSPEVTLSANFDSINIANESLKKNNPSPDNIHQHQPHGPSASDADIHDNSVESNSDLSVINFIDTFRNDDRIKAKKRAYFAGDYKYVLKSNNFASTGMQTAKQGTVGVGHQSIMAGPAIRDMVNADCQVDDPRLSALRKTIQKLEGDLDDVQGQTRVSIAKAEAKAETISIELDRSREQTAESLQQMHHLQKLLRDQTAESTALGVEVKATKASMQAATVERQRAEERAKSSLQRAYAAEGKSSRLQEEVSSLEQHVAVLKAEMDGRKSSYDALSSEFNLLKQEKDTLQATLNSAVEQRSNAQAQLESALGRIEELRTDVKALQLSRAKLQDQNTDLANQIIETERKSQTFMADLTEREAHSDAKLASYWSDALQSMVGDLQLRVKEEKSLRQEVMHQLEDIDKTVAEREKKFKESAEKEIATLKSQLEHEKELREAAENTFSDIFRKLYDKDRLERALKRRLELIQDAFSRTFGADTPMPWSPAFEMDEFVQRAKTSQTDSASSVAAAAHKLASQPDTKRLARKAHLRSSTMDAENSLHDPYNSMPQGESHVQSSTKSPVNSRESSSLSLIRSRGKGQTSFSNQHSKDCSIPGTPSSTGSHNRTISDSEEFDRHTAMLSLAQGLQYVPEKVMRRLLSERPDLTESLMHGEPKAMLHAKDEREEKQILESQIRHDWGSGGVMMDL